jgi:hypothetical protein
MKEFDTSRRYTVGEAIIRLREIIEQVDFNYPAPVQSALDLDDLAKIVPRQQQVAPVQFSIKGEKINISSRPPKTLPADKSNILAALDHISSAGGELIENLERSNCDKRLLDKVKELQAQLVSGENIVRIGLSNMACGMMCAQFQSELPFAISGMFRSYNDSISMYVAQFPEWEQFTTKASTLNLNDEDIAEIKKTSGEVIKSLEENPDISAPEVPKTISLIQEFLKFPGMSAKRGAFAMLRTLENLVSSIVRHTLDFIDKTTKKL